MTHIYFSARAEGRISYRISAAQILVLHGVSSLNEQAVREAATICPAPSKFTFDLVTLKVVCESRATWPTSVPNLVFLGLSVLDLDPIIINIIIIYIINIIIIWLLLLLLLLLRKLI